ncbi:MAG: hypothetical protein WDZ29_03760 [Balneolaceae bacterium]
MSQIRERHGMDPEESYRHRILAGLALVLFVSVLIVRFWPVEEKSAPDMPSFNFTEQALIDDIHITRQESSPAPPPVPSHPQPVPVDEIIDAELEIDESVLNIDFPDLPDELGTALDGEEDVIVSDPQLPPTVTKIVEPHVPDLPAELRGRVEMFVNFLVDADGQVEEASITEIRVYEEDLRNYEVLPFIQYGLMSATLQSAMLWEFRPARDQGTGVRTYTVHRFNY